MRQGWQRVVAALLGGYAFTWSFAVLGIAMLTSAGVSYVQAEAAVFLAAFLIYVIMVLWVFVARSVTFAWLMLLGGAALMTSGAWVLEKASVFAGGKLHV